MMTEMICPICRTEFDRRLSPALPFCSQRCQLVDLRRWLGEEYGFPVEPEAEFDPDEEYPA